MRRRIIALVLIPMLLSSGCTIDDNSHIESEEHQSEDTLKNFTNVKFENKEFVFDGESHSLTLTGAPEGSTITYQNNSKTEVGVYTVKATLSKEGYNTKTYTATLTIKGRQITGVVFENTTFKYDGKAHSIYASNLPEGTQASYSGNGKVVVGSYTVTATITGRGYEKLILKAVLTISNIKDFPDAEFNDFYLIYDNRDINIANYFSSYEWNLDTNYTSYYDVEYRINGVTKTNPTIKEVGTYDISATYSASNYETKTIGFKIVISDQIGGVDLAKSAFQFSNDTKFNDLYDEIKKGNYSVKCTYHDEYDRDFDGNFEDIKDSPNISYYFVTPEAFAGRHNEDSLEYASTDYYITKGTNYAYEYQYDYYSITKSKFPASSYLETVTNISDGMAPFALLQESETGGFKNSQIGGYHDSYGSYVIDTNKNQLTIASRVHYFHKEWNHDEVTEYTFYNIGNTKVTLPDEVKGSDSQASSFEIGSFVENGIDYVTYGEDFTADVTLNEFDDAYLGGSGSFILRPEVDGIPIKAIDYNVYWSYYYVDHSKYELYVYFDNDGYYQGEYANLGYVKYYLDARKYGILNYYGEWDI